MDWDKNQSTGGELMPRTKQHNPKAFKPPVPVSIEMKTVQPTILGALS